MFIAEAGSMSMGYQELLNAFAGYSSAFEELRRLAKSGRALQFVSMPAEPRNLLSSMVHHVIGPRLEAWKTAFKLATEIDDEGERLRRMRCIAWVETEVRTNSFAVLTLLDDSIVPTAPTPTLQAAFLLIKGKFCHQLAGLLEGPARLSMSNHAEQAYISGQEIVQPRLHVTHPLLLELVFNYSVFLYNIRGAPGDACRVAQQALDEATRLKIEVSPVLYSEYRSVTNRLRVQLAAWTKQLVSGGQPQQKSPQQRRPALPPPQQQQQQQQQQRAVPPQKQHPALPPPPQEPSQQQDPAPLPPLQQQQQQGWFLDKKQVGPGGGVVVNVDADSGEDAWHGHHLQPLPGGDGSATSMVAVAEQLQRQPSERARTGRGGKAAAPAASPVTTTPVLAGPSAAAAMGNAPLPPAAPPAEETAPGTLPCPPARRLSTKAAAAAAAAAAAEEAEAVRKAVAKAARLAAIEAAFRWGGSPDAHRSGVIDVDSLLETDATFVGEGRERVKAAVDQAAHIGISYWMYSDPAAEVERHKAMAHLAKCRKSRGNGTKGANAMLFTHSAGVDPPTSSAPSPAAAASAAPLSPALRAAAPPRGTAAMPGASSQSAAPASATSRPAAPACAGQPAVFANHFLYVPLKEALASEFVQSAVDLTPTLCCVLRAAAAAPSSSGSSNDGDDDSGSSDSDSGGADPAGGPAPGPPDGSPSSSSGGSSSGSSSGGGGLSGGRRSTSGDGSGPAGGSYAAVCQPEPRPHDCLNQYTAHVAWALAEVYHMQGVTPSMRANSAAASRALCMASPGIGVICECQQLTELVHYALQRVRVDPLDISQVEFNRSVLCSTEYALQEGCWTMDLEEVLDGVGFFQWHEEPLDGHAGRAVLPVAELPAAPVEEPPPAAAAAAALQHTAAFEPPHVAALHARHAGPAEQLRATAGLQDVPPAELQDVPAAELQDVPPVRLLSPPSVGSPLAAEEAAGEPHAKFAPL